MRAKCLGSRSMKNAPCAAHIHGAGAVHCQNGVREGHMARWRRPASWCTHWQAARTEERRPGDGGREMKEQMDAGWVHCHEDSVSSGAGAVQTATQPLPLRQVSLLSHRLVPPAREHASTKHRGQHGAGLLQRGSGSRGSVSAPPSTKACAVQQRWSWLVQPHEPRKKA